MADQQRRLTETSTMAHHICSAVKHPIVLAIDALTVTLYLWEALMIRPSSTVAVTITAIALVPVIATAYLPCLAWLTFQILSIVSAFCPYICEELPSTHFSLLFALGLIAYRHSTRAAVCMLSGSVAIQLFTAILPTFQDSILRDIPSFIVMYTMSTLLGCSLRWREELFTTRLREQQISQHNILLQRNVRLSQRIHDSVTGELSFIVRLAQQQIRSTNGTEWRQVRDSAREALRQVRHVIDTLDQTDNPEDGNLTDADQLDHIRSVMLQGDQAAHAVNMHGRGSLHVIGNCPLTQKQEQLIIDTLNEVYANILRHAPDGSSFELSVLMDSDAVQITQLNPMPEQATGNGMPRSGHGLANLCKRVEHADGRLVARPENEDWTFYAVIPVSP